MSDQDLPRSRRHGLLITVWGLIVLVLVIGASLGWLLRSARLQREAVAAIWSAGGSVIYDWQYKDGEFTPFSRPGWPEWLVARLGVDYFGHVNWVGRFDFRWPDDGPMTEYEKRRINEALAQIGNLSQLEELDFEGSEAGDSWRSRSAPIAEETFYRGLFFNALRQRIHPILAAPIQAAVFGYSHPFGLGNSAAIGVAALIFALVYEWRKTLLTPILLHSGVNAVGMMFLAGSLAADAAAPRIGVLGEPSQGGCQVTEMVPGGPAEAAGLQVGDVITAVDGEPVADITGVARVIRKHQLGDTVSVEFLRGGKAHRADVVLMRLKK